MSDNAHLVDLMEQKAADMRNRPVTRVWFFLLFIAVGLVLTFFMFVKPCIESLSAKNWVKQECRILKSRVVTKIDHDNSISTKFDVMYEYSYGGQSRQSTRYSFFDICPTQTLAQNMVSKFPAGSVRECYVNPANPSKAVLERDIETYDLLGLLPLLFTAAGTMGLLQQRKRKPRQEFKPNGFFKEVTLKRNSRLKKAIIVFFFALVFCGSDIMFWKTTQMTISFRTLWQILDTILTIQSMPVYFGVVIGLVGLLLLVGSLQSFMEIFNPQVRIKLTPSPVEIGKAAAIAWNVQGRIQRLKHLRITIECRAGCTKLYSEELAATADMQEIANGQFGFVIEPDQAPTFKNEQDHIDWYVVIKGQIRRWPDIEDEFEFEVIKNQGTVQA